MAEPFDAIRAFHNAFRQDMTRVDKGALEAARGGKDLSAAVDRYKFFNDVLGWHAHGEELAVFPAVEAVAPLVAESYEKDHRGLDAAFEAFNTAVMANDTLAAARASAAFKFHLDIHLNKEDLHLYRILRERTTPQDQGRIVGIMANEVPKEHFSDVVTWLMPLIGLNDRENMTRIYQMVLPPPVFEQVKLLIQQAIGKEWDDLVVRIPELK